MQNWLAFHTSASAAMGKNHHHIFQTFLKLNKINYILRQQNVFNALKCSTCICNTLRIALNRILWVSWDSLTSILLIINSLSLRTCFFSARKGRKPVVLCMPLLVSIKYFSQTIPHAGSSFAQNSDPLLSINKPNGSWEHGSTFVGKWVNRAAYHFHHHFHLFFFFNWYIQ